MYHELVTLKNKDDESDIDSESDDVIENIAGDLADASDGGNETNKEKEYISKNSPEKMPMVMMMKMIIILTRIVIIRKFK